MLPHSRGAQVRAIVPAPVERRTPLAAPPHRRRGRVIVVLLALAAAVAAAWWQRSRTQAAKPAPAPVKTVKVRKMPLERTIRVPGITTAENFRAMLAPNLSGTRSVMGHTHEFTLTLQTLAKPGSFVKKGDVIAEFDKQYQINRLDDYYSLVRQHEYNLQRLKAILDVRRTSYEQQVRVAKGRMDKAALDVKKAPVLSFIRGEKLRLLYSEARDRYNELRNSEKHYDISEESAVRWSELDLKQARIEYDRAHRNVERMKSVAPSDGLVVMLNTRRGSDLGPIEAGDQLQFGQPYMQIVDLSAIVVNASVNQVDAEQLRGGIPARVHIDAYPDLEIPAHVISVSAMARQGGWRASYVRSVPVRLKLEKNDPRVIPNLSANVDLVLDEAPPAPAVPLECVFHDAADDDTYVFVQTPAGWEKRDIELGFGNYIETQIRAGLSEGEIVAAERPR